MEQIPIEKAAELLLQNDDVLILCHRRPDGDTIGSAFALYYALKELGKRSRIECSDPFPNKFFYLYEEYQEEDFVPQLIVTVDLATTQLLGGLYETYKDRIDLAVDHHKSNDFYATYTLLDADAPATTELMFLLIQEMGVELNTNIANALFTGLVTDTGGLRFASVTSRTHQVASKLIDGGAEHATINRLLFDTVSKGRLQVEALAIKNLELHLNDRLALLHLPADVKETYHIEEEELDGLSSLPRMIEGVLAGITIRELGENNYRVSFRSHPPLDSSNICKEFGGGGHANAAGCTLTGELEDIKKRLIDAVRIELDRHQ